MGSKITSVTNGSMTFTYSDIESTNQLVESALNTNDTNRVQNA
jgi:hypothetical protein